MAQATSQNGPIDSCLRLHVAPMATIISAMAPTRSDQAARLRNAHHTTIATAPMSPPCAPKLKPLNPGTRACMPTRASHCSATMTTPGHKPERSPRSRFVGLSDGHIGSTASDLGRVPRVPGFNCARSVAGRQGVSQTRSRKPNKHWRLSLKPNRVSDLPSSIGCGCFHLFAAVFRFCGRDVTQNVTRCELLPNSSRRRLLSAVPPCF